MKVTIDIPLLQEPDEKVARLVELVFEAHQVAAKNNASASSEAVCMAAGGSGSFRQAVVAALMTLGIRHGPIGAARLVFTTDSYHSIESGAKIPGWGNSFFKDGIDPAWQKVDDYLKEHFEQEWSKVDAVTNELHAAGKRIYPNAAIYTAIACELCHVPAGLEELFFILPRLPVWAELAL